MITNKQREEAEAGLPSNEFLTDLHMDFLAEVLSQEYKEVIPVVVTTVSELDSIPF